MKRALALLTTLLLAQFVTPYPAKAGSDKTKLDITYKTTAQGPLRLDLHDPAVPEAGANYRSPYMESKVRSNMVALSWGDRKWNYDSSANTVTEVSAGGAKKANE